ncbi:bleomycin resistance protein [Roseovarius sp. MMSF_3281]|uniref:bleomycin resistance protein n=1 Tax=Roseovarius sp. MMSF_3281 TaxID=3046694 RepID=UPI00273F92BF|nr:bleomycin resistance protein [Roseovarius sp. MMSF_3281]
MSTGKITANLPSRDFDVTEAFYAKLGFHTDFRNDGWMIMNRGGGSVEFFPHPELQPSESWFSACLRVPDIDSLHADWQAATGLSGARDAIPRLTAPFELPEAPRMFALIDPDGSLWRVIESE